MENQILDNNLLKNDTNQPKWAGFWIRVGATLIDILVYLPLIGLNMYNLYVLKSLPLQLIITAIMLAYKPFMEYKYGATLGKMAVKIKVVNSNLESISLGQSIIRYSPWLLGQVFSIIGTVLLFQHSDFEIASGMMEMGLLQQEVISPIYNYISSAVLLISVVVVAFQAKKQGLHDLLAGTYCIYTN